MSGDARLLAAVLALRAGRAALLDARRRPRRTRAQAPRLGVRQDEAGAVEAGGLFSGCVDALTAAGRGLRSSGLALARGRPLTLRFAGRLIDVAADAGRLTLVVGPASAGVRGRGSRR